MFQAVGTSVDPQRRLRLVVAFVVAMVLWAVLWLARVVLGLGWGLLSALLATLLPEPVVPPSPLEVKEVELVRMEEMVVLDPELTPDMLPPPPPPSSPPPPAPAEEPAPPPPAPSSPPPEAAAPEVEPPAPASESAQGGQAGAESSGLRAVMSLDVASLMGSGVGAGEGALLGTLSGMDDEVAELSAIVSTDMAEESEVARAARLDAVARARARGLLSLRAADATFEPPPAERDPWDTDPPDEEPPEPPEWDGLFGPRDVHLLLDALAEEEARKLAQGAVTGSGTLGTSDGSGYRLSASHMGGGAFGGGMMVLRIPPTRDLLEAAEPKLPRAERRALEEPVECVFFVEVDPFGLPIETTTVSCPEALEPYALDAVRESRWKLADDLEEQARVRFVVTFER